MARAPARAIVSSGQGRRLVVMRRSEFDRAINDEFGEAYGASLLRDVVLGALRDRTAREALEQGVPPREVWLALCREMQVPEARWHGVGRLDPRSR